MPLVTRFPLCNHWLLHIRVGVVKPLFVTFFRIAANLFECLIRRKRIGSLSRTGETMLKTETANLGLESTFKRSLGNRPKRNTTYS